jgi:hypothetical protein
MPPASSLRFPYRHELRMPVIGLEAEFKVHVDGQEVTPEELWRTPSGFIDQRLLRRSRKSSQLPTGGALYFDGGVIEVVTPVIELAPHCTGRAVRSLWEQIEFVREQLDRWEARTGRQVRLEAFSCHFNVSYELPRSERNSKRTIQKLAMLLAHLLPVPVLLTGANRASSGMGVRPRRDRIEITLDFTPDPALMAATTALIVGVVREVLLWPSYLLDELEEREIPVLAGVKPGKHATRNGWVVRAFNFAHDPFQTPPDDRVWKTTDGQPHSLREVALGIASRFRASIDRWSDPFSVRILFAVLAGDVPSLLDLEQRPPAYDDVARAIRWGGTIPELDNLGGAMRDEGDSARRRAADVEQLLAPPWRGALSDRRSEPGHPRGTDQRASNGDRRDTPPAPSDPLSRSAYEEVFRHLGSGTPLEIEGQLLTPVGVKGWYHALFLDAEGQERMLSIDDVLDHGGRWRVEETSELASR